MSRVIAVIPARGGSKGIPKKNLAKLGEHTLLSKAISEAKKSKYIDTILVNTDCDDLAAEAECCEVKVIRRPSDMGSDVAEVDPLLTWTLSQLDKSEKPDIMVLLYCTAPLRNVTDIDSTIELVADKGYDSALTLVEDHSYLWCQRGDVFEPTNYIPTQRASRQTEKWNQFVENKAVYVFKVDDLLKSGCRLNGRIGAVMMPANRSIDVDAIEDLELAARIANTTYETA